MTGQQWHLHQNPVMHDSVYNLVEEEAHFHHLCTLTATMAHVVHTSWSKSRGRTRKLATVAAGLAEPKHCN